MTNDITNRAREQQLDALLHESAGILPQPNLADRIINCLPNAAERPFGSRQTWLAAAIVLLALSVVGGIAWLQRGDTSSAAMAPIPELQDPKPVPKKPKAVLTLIADYSDNRVVEVDENGKEVFVLDDVFGAWDAERMQNGNLLITEFSVSRVLEVDRKGKHVWAYEGLKNPYDADQLANGNILIANTFGGSVLEVEPDYLKGRGGKIVWQFKGVRPFDADRLPNGNTLIADVLRDRVIEVNPAGKIVWQAKDVPNIHDADRLPNGNTLVTLRNLSEVREIDKAGEIVWRRKGLNSPSDADRLPNGNTLVAENTQVRELDKDGKVVWKKETTWAVEANRYIIR